jgi:F-type H+-transporting ATPase subunit b
MEFLGKIGIDYKLLIAQIINFLVLLWLLKILLYKPILKRLEERVKKLKEIEEGEREIKRKKIQTQQETEKMIQKARERTRKILEESKEISEKEKERILKRAEAEVREILKEAKEKAEVEIEKLKEKEKEIIKQKTKEIIKEVLSLAFTRELHQKYLREVIEELKGLNFKKLQDRDIVLVETIFAFPPTEKVEREIRDFLFSKLKNPVFKTRVDPELIAGMKISIEQGLFLIDGSLKGKIEKVLYDK